MIKTPQVESASILDKVEDALNDDKPKMAMTLLHTAQPQIKATIGASPHALRRYFQLLAVTRIQLAHKPPQNSTTETSICAWWDVFGIANPSEASITEVKRQYKRLAALIHPDKCNLQGAGAAFTLLQDGLEVLLANIADREGGKEQKRKKAKRSSGNEEAPATDDGSAETEEEPSGDLDDDEFAWWSEWDDTWADKWSKNQKNSSENESSKAPEESEEEKDMAALAKLSSEELLAEFNKRQKGLFSPLLPGENLSHRRAAIVRARAAINAKLEEEKKANGAGGATAPKNEGGFLR